MNKPSLFRFIRLLRLLPLLMGLLLAGLLPLASWAQAPTNDNCAAAVLLTAATPLTPTAGTVTNATDSGVGNAFGDADDDVWYRFVATRTQHHIIVTPTGNGSLVHQLYGGGCPGPTATALVTSDPEDMVASGLVPGQTYHVRVYSFFSSPVPAADGGFTIAVNEPGPPPANDNCAAATLLTSAPTCTIVTGTLAGSTDSGIPAIFGESNDDVWYRFVATSTQHNIIVESTGGVDLVHELFAACPGPTTPALFNSDPENMIASGLTVGQTYYVRVFSYFDSLVDPADSGFTICVTAPGVVVANDECSTAIALTSPSLNCVTTAGTLFGATQSTVLGSTPGTADDDVWYSFVANSTNAGIYLTTTGGLDLVVDLRTSPCGSSTSLRTGDQGGSSIGSVDSISTRRLTVGQTYFVRVYSFFSAPATAANGGFTLCVQTPGSCAPPTALNATNITNTSATLAWTDGAGANNFIVEYGPTGFTPGSGTVLSSNSSFVGIMGLTAATAYQFYVTQNCGSGLNSVRVGPQPFSTTGLNNLIVLNGQTLTNVQGSYDNVTVQAGGSATLSGLLTVAQTVVVEDGGILITNCQLIRGTASFTLQAGGELRICEQLGIYETSDNGAIRVTGTRSYSNDASYTYNGTSPQNPGPGLPAVVRNLTLDNPAGMNINTLGVDVRRVLRLTRGTLTTAVSTVRLLSNASGTALIDNSGTGQVNGVVTVQRYVDPAFNAGLGYRHFSAPVQNQPVSALGSSGSPIVVNNVYNTTAPASRGSVTPYPTVFSFNESAVPAGGTVADFDQGWESPAATTSPLVAGRGYTVQVAGGQTTTLTGIPNNGPLALTGLTYGPGGSQGGWHLRGNPYPSPLDWSTLTVGTAGTDNLQNMNGAVYVYQSNGPYTGTYRSYQNGLGGSPLIASGQGFFVRTAGVGQSGTLRLSNANRVTTWSANNSSLYRGPVDLRPQLRLTLAGPAATTTDETTVYFETGATAASDARFDAFKLRNIGPATNVFTLAGPDELSINGLAPLTTLDVVVPLGLSVPAAGSYTLRAADLLNFASTTVWLRDAQTGTLLNLSPQASYSFTVAANALSSSTRFSLLFRPGTVTATATTLAAAQVALFPNPTHDGFTLLMPKVAGAQTVSAQLINALGQVVQSRSLPAGAAGVEARFDVRGLAAGVYSLRLQAGAEAPFTKRVVVE